MSSLKIHCVYLCEVFGQEGIAVTFFFQMTLVSYSGVQKVTIANAMLKHVHAFCMCPFGISVCKHVHLQVNVACKYVGIQPCLFIRGCADEWTNVSILHRCFDQRMYLRESIGHTHTLEIITGSDPTYIYIHIYICCVCVCWEKYMFICIHVFMYICIYVYM